MRLLSKAAMIITIAALVISVVGCGGKKSARAVAQAFVNGMKSGNTRSAADYWDYSALGRANNEDWDTFGRSQRNLIVKEMKWAEKRASELEYWRTRFPNSTEVADVVEEGDSAIATLSGGRVGEIELVKVGDDWYVSAIK